MVFTKWTETANCRRKNITQFAFLTYPLQYKIVRICFVTRHVYQSPRLSLLCHRCLPLLSHNGVMVSMVLIEKEEHCRCPHSRHCSPSSNHDDRTLSSQLCTARWSANMWFLSTRIVFIILCYANLRCLLFKKITFRLIMVWKLIYYTVLYYIVMS